ncbi:MAG: DNA polymerase IV [Candidatus Zambryskibacteria bacterium]|nr:DNA polymerase IV [Candidatus Zambryskibacteria bacterium]
MPKVTKKRREKVILHMDGDAFFVACEVAKNPKLRGFPVVTGQERGIVSALSYEAKALGVTRGYPIFKLKKHFPQVIILPGDYECYAKLSSQMFDIVRRYADDVEEYSIDECFANLTGLDKPLYMSYKEIGERIKREITGELQLSVTVGLAPTKVLAKVASKWQKPNGFTIITRETAPEFLKETSISKIWGIGVQTTNFLHGKGIDTALQFAEKNVEWVRENLSSPYEALWLELNSVSVMKVNPETKSDYSSVQKTRTFYPTTNDKIFLLSQLSKHIEDACKKARHYSLVAKKFSFFLKSQDFKYFSYSVDLPIPTASPEPIVELMRLNFHKIWSKGVIYRTTGATLFELVSCRVTQKDLFGGIDKENKLEAVHKTIDDLENKFGKRIVYLGSTHDALKSKREGTDVNDLNRNLLFL